MESTSKLRQEWQKSWYWRGPGVLACCLGCLFSLRGLYRSFFRSAPTPAAASSSPEVSTKPKYRSEADCAVKEQLQGVWEFREKWFGGLPSISNQVSVPWEHPGRRFLFLTENEMYEVNYNPDHKSPWEILGEVEYPVFDSFEPGTVDVSPDKPVDEALYSGFHNESWIPGRWKLDGNRLTMVTFYNHGAGLTLKRPELIDKPGEGIWYVLERVDRERETLPVFDIDPKTLPPYKGSDSSSDDDLFSHTPIRSQAPPRSDHPGFRSGTISTKADLGQLPESLQREIESAFDKPAEKPPTTP